MLAAAFYGRIGWVLVSRSRKPTCRLCLYRHCCPIRKLCLLDPGGNFCYEKTAVGIASE